MYLYRRKCYHVRTLLTGLVSQALICSFSRMIGHVGFGDAKQEDISEDTVKYVAETLKISPYIKISEDIVSVHFIVVMRV